VSAVAFCARPTIAHGTGRDAALPVLAVAGDVHALGCRARGYDHRLRLYGRLLRPLRRPHPERPAGKVDLVNALPAKPNGRVYFPLGENHAAPGADANSRLGPTSKCRRRSAATAPACPPLGSGPRCLRGNQESFPHLSSWSVGRLYPRMNRKLNAGTAHQRHLDTIVADVSYPAYQGRCHRQIGLQTPAAASWRGRHRWPPCGRCGERRIDRSITLVGHVIQAQKPVRATGGTWVRYR